MLGSSKTVLMIGDEALYIYSSGLKGVELVEAVPWDADDFENNTAKIIAKDCGGKSVVILNDMVEQHYRKERVPKVNMMDRKNVVTRKLGVAFPNYPAKAAIALKEKLPKTDKMPASSVYIFAAAPHTEQYKKAVNAVRKSLASIVGYGLLPIEGAGLVKTLAGKLTSRTQAKAKWAVFIGQHQNGGLRQVVIKDGELALTRMTPVIDSDADPEVWASEVYQEFQATLSYMARFGFSEDQGLDIMIVTNPPAGEILSGIIDINARIHTFTASEAAKKLGVSITSYSNQRYADVLYAGWICKKGKLQLPMQGKELEAISRPRQMAALSILLLICGAAYLGYESYTKLETLFVSNERLTDIRSRIVNLDSEYQVELKKKEALGFDVRLVQNSILIYDGLEASNVKALDVFGGIGKALGRDLRIDNIALSRISKENTSAMASFGGYVNPDQKVYIYEARIQLTYPSTIDIDKGNEEIEALREKLQTSLPEHSVTVEKYLKDTEYVDELVMTPGNTDEENVAQDFVVSLSIKGGAL